MTPDKYNCTAYLYKVHVDELVGRVVQFLTVVLLGESCDPQSVTRVQLVLQKSAAGLYYGDHLS